VQTPRLALAGLALLAMPVIASLQFYAGFPLRIATAELSTRLLQAFDFAVQRSGTAMWVGDKLVIVDAPCSGVQMVWMAYFCACALGWWRQLPDRLLLRRLAGVGAIVLAGNVVRNSVLVALEASATPPGPVLHEAVGLIVLAAVCAAVLRLVRGARDATR
jgi:exosortase/archaeosortase family protein